MKNYTYLQQLLSVDYRTKKENLPVDSSKVDYFIFVHKNDDKEIERLIKNISSDSFLKKSETIIQSMTVTLLNNQNSHVYERKGEINNSLFDQSLKMNKDQNERKNLNQGLMEQLTNSFSPGNVCFLYGSSLSTFAFMLSQRCLHTVTYVDTDKINTLSYQSFNSYLMH